MSLELQAPISMLCQSNPRTIPRRRIEPVAADSSHNSDKPGEELSVPGTGDKDQ